jgi:hypothetical protein
MSISSTGIYGSSYLYEDVEELKTNLTTLTTSHLSTVTNHDGRLDILETDKFGKLKITKNGCLKRDLFVLNLCKENKIPIACAMGGGYSPKIADIVDAHCNTFKAAINLFD